MARVVVLGLMILVTLLIKTTMLPAIAIGGIRPDLIALLIVAVALMEGPDVGMRLGFVAGLIQDFLGGPSTIVGAGALMGLIIGWVAGGAKPFIAANIEIGSLGVACVGAGLMAGGQAFIAGLLGATNIALGDVLRITIFTLLYSLIVAPLVLWIGRSISNALPRATVGQL